MLAIRLNVCYSGITRIDPRHITPFNPMTTLHTYSDLIHGGDRLAATVWGGNDASRAVAATIAHDPDAIVLRVADWRGQYVAVAHAPGGAGVI